MADITLAAYIPALTEATLDGTEDLAIVKDGVTKRCSTQDIADLGGASLITRKTTLSSAEILALNTTPKIVVPAPGAGFLIQPLFITVRVNYGTTTYATNVVMQLKYDTISGNISTNTFIAASATTVSRQGLTTSINFSPSPENKALVVDVQTGNPTTGDSTINIYISYALITL